MSIQHRLSREGDAPKLTITLVGDHEIVRFCSNLLDDQCEFGAVGRKVLVSRKRAWGSKRWRAYVGSMFDEKRARLLGNIR